MKLLTSNKRHIYAQGDIDGTCFLYSIINAFIALTGDQPEFSLICNMLNKAKFPKDFLVGNIGTTKNYSPELLLGTISSSLKELGNYKFSVSKVNVQNSGIIRSLADAINDKSVAIIHYNGNSKILSNMNHWVCGVAKEDQEIHVACSVIFQKLFILYKEYTETFHKETSRWSNDIISINSNIVENELYQVRLI